ncbi:site-specific integrase [Streptomyces sp. DH12]|uniref:tyrosine-type recombinase/integrase n=1 Tax=Streptomyces sp. DH12 TaxID=2857010 RepID=UPI001E39B82E|nr:site-specific integrase [Streptomyces sp. DH12]
MTAPKRKKARANGEGTIYQRKDGRWESAGYVLAADGTRIRVRVYGSTRRGAADKLAEKIADSNRGLPVATADSTVGDYLTYWLNSVAIHRLRENTHTRYASCVRLHLIPGLGTKKIARLTTKDVRTFLDRLRTTCQCCAQGLDAVQKRCCSVGECCQKRLSALTVTYVHSVLKSALEHAVREDELPRDVARNVKTTTHQPRRFRPLTAAEARQFLDAARADRLHAPYEPALRTGLRKGELLGLRWEDLDLTTGTASIRRSLQRTRTGGLTHLPTRAGRPSAVSRSRPNASTPSRSTGTAGKGARDRRAGLENNGLVFTMPTGRPLDPANLTRRFRSFLHRAGLRRIRFHDLRHSTATLLLEQGVELVVIKELLGHAHIGVTATVYAHVRLRLQRHAIDILSTALDGTTDTNPPHDDGDDTPLCAAPFR